MNVPVTTSSDGVVFRAGVNHLTSSTALPYVRQSSLTEEGRVLRQQALLRAIVAKVVSKDLITNPLRDLSLLDAFTAALSVDSDFTNSGLLSLAGKPHLLRSGSSTFVTAPVLGSAANSTPVQLDTPVADELWQAIRHDSVAAFARQFPATLTPPRRTSCAARNLIPPARPGRLTPGPGFRSSHVDRQAGERGEDGLHHIPGHVVGLGDVGVSANFRTGTSASESGKFEAELASAPPGGCGAGGQAGVAQDG